jgi:signal transduction histidine kinase
MPGNTNRPFARTLAERIRVSREELTRRWLELILARVSPGPSRVFPSAELLEHVPVLMEGVADYVSDPCDEVGADVPVIARAMELGALRFSQGFEAHEILREYEILGGVLFNFAAEVAGEAEPCTPRELLTCTHRLFRAISVIEQATTGNYLRALNERVSEREERLRRFNRMVTHELKNRVGALLGAGRLLREPWLEAEERREFAAIVVENARDIEKLLSNLSALTRVDGDARRQKNILLPQAVAEVFRQLRGLARSRGVRLLTVGELPRVEVNAAAIELCLSNYVSNAIKYSAGATHDPWVKLEATLAESPADSAELVVCVRDNGPGVPPAERAELFERFFRGRGTDEEEGTGLGLSLVRETVDSLGGRVWAEFPSSGAVFGFALPCRRAPQRGASGADEAAHGPARGGGGPAAASGRRTGGARSGRVHRERRRA